MAGDGEAQAGAATRSRRLAQPRREAMLARALAEAERLLARPGDPGALPRMPGHRRGAARAAADGRL